jgi:hypothetical protein
MSQHDDELLTTLRAELARRASTTPREGFDMRMQTSVRALQRPRHTHRALAAGLAVATVAAFAVALVVGLRAHQSRSTVPAGPVPSPSHAPVPASGSLMVFQSKVSDTHYTTTLARGDGTVIRTVDAPGAAYGDALGGRALYLDDGHHGWVLHRDGSITTVNAAARMDLAAAGKGVTMVDDHTAVADVPNNQAQTSRFEVVDVLTGARRVVFEEQAPPDAQPSSRSDVAVVGISRDMGTLYVLVRDMEIGGKLQRDPVVDDVDVALARVTGTRALPSGDSDMAVSPDGRQVAWQDAAVDARNAEYFVTHVTDLSSGRTVDVAGTGIGAGGGFGPGLVFSPDGARLMVTGHDNEATPVAIDSVAEVSTADGRVLQHQQIEHQAGEIILTIGWVDADHLAYGTTTNANQDGRLVGIEATSVVDLSGPKPPLTIGNLGSFVAVLR